MNNLSLGEIFRGLERAVKFAGDRGGRLFLEPLDPELSAELEKIIDRGASRASEVSGKLGVDERPWPKENKNRLVPEPPERDSAEPSSTLNLRPEDARTLYSLRLRLRDCALCPLCLERKTMVFGQGNINADIMFIGEAPGAEEDRSGLAFVGKAGKLLTQIIQSVGLSREEVYICNVIKCRPPGNRAPNSGEINKCAPFLFKQIDLLKPKLIVILGAVALKTLSPQSPGITKVRGKLSEYKGIPALPTFHPSYLLRNASALPQVWSDMRRIRQILRRLSSEPSKNAGIAEQSAELKK